MTLLDRRTFLLGGAGLFAVTACSTPPSGALAAGAVSGATSKAAGAPTGADSIVLLTALVPETINPIAGFANTGMGKINEGLLTLSGGSDSLPDLVPQLAAADPEVSADAQTWTVTLKKGVLFSDGSPLTAADVVATYEAVKDPASASPIAGDLLNLRTVEAVDDTTVTFTLEEPQVSFRTALLIGIAPAAMIEKGTLVQDSALNQQPIGTGPYLLDSYTTDRLVYTVNPRYRGAAPQLATVSYVLAADDNTRAQRMTAGEFDGSILPPRLAKTFEGNADFEIVPATSADWRGISFPADHPVTTDPAVRMALNIGIDRQAILDGVLVGFGRPADTFVPPEYGEFYNPEAVFPFDRERATAMLEEAGWVAGADGIRAKDGVRAAYTVLYRPSDQLRRDLSAAFASEALELGFDISVEGVDLDRAEPRAGLDAILLGGGDTPYDVDTQLYKSLHSSYPAAGAFYDNLSRYANPEMDALLERGRTSLDPADRSDAYRQVQALYVTEPSMLLLVFLDHTYVQRASLRKDWVGTPTLLEPHEHGTAWGPWANLERWKRTGS